MSSERSSLCRCCFPYTVSNRRHRAPPCQKQTQRRGRTRSTDSRPKSRDRQRSSLSIASSCLHDHRFRTCADKPAHTSCTPSRNIKHKLNLIARLHNFAMNRMRFPMMFLLSGLWAGRVVYERCCPESLTLNHNVAFSAIFHQTGFLPHPAHFDSFLQRTSYKPTHRKHTYSPILFGG